MNEIYGNNYLISVAWTASTPTQAAKNARLMGCSREQVRAIHNAAKIKRDEGELAFHEKFQPWELVDVDVNGHKNMKVRLQLNKSFEKRPLNAAEWNEAAKLIVAELKKLGIEAKVDLKEVHSYIKSTL